MDKSHNGGRPHGGHGEHHRHHRGRDGKRPSDYRACHLLLPTRIVEKPSPGYDLMKAIGESMGGIYSPSLGAIYPKPAWSENIGYPRLDMGAACRKRYRIAVEGRAMENEKLALRSRLSRPIDRQSAEAIARAPEAAVQAIERS